MAAGAAGGGGPRADGGNRSPALSEPVLDPSRILASIPDDPEVEKADLEARPIIAIPEGSQARRAVRGLAERVRSLCTGP